MKTVNRQEHLNNQDKMCTVKVVHQRKKYFQAHLKFDERE